MISAKEAREQSEQYLKSKLDKKIEMIEQKRIRAVSCGKKYIKIEYSISENAEQVLNRLGYKVKDDALYNGYVMETYTIIKW